MTVYQKQAGMGGNGPRSPKLLQGVHIQSDRCYPCVYLIDTGKGLGASFGESASTLSGCGSRPHFCSTHHKAFYENEHF